MWLIEFHEVGCGAMFASVAATDHLLTTLVVWQTTNAFYSESKLEIQLLRSTSEAGLRYTHIQPA